MGFITAEEMYKRDSKLKKEDVKILRDWMGKEPHLPEISDVVLLFFLHSCYYKIEATKTCIENFFTIKAHCPEFLLNQDPRRKDVEQQLRILCITALPEKTKENYTVVISKLMDKNPDLYDYNNQIKVIDMVGTLNIMQNGPSEGLIMVMDSEGFTFTHMLKSNLSTSKKHLHFIQEALPVRLKAIHVVNISSITEKFLNLLRPFIKKELFDMIFLHRGYETLYQHISKESLPKEYGGNLGTFEELQKKMYENVMAHSQFFIDHEKLVSDETKRVGKPKNMADIFGIEGTFKKLDID